MITIRYIGRDAATHIKGKVTGRSYGYRRSGAIFQIDPRDLENRFVPIEAPVAPEPVEIKTVEVPTDDLTKIKGITKPHAQTLNNLGVFTYQGLLSDLSADDLAAVLNIPADKATEIMLAVRDKVGG